MNTRVAKHQKCKAYNQNMKTIKLGYLLKILTEGECKKKWLSWCEKKMDSMI